MKALDKLYLNFYWCWNTQKGGELKDASLEKVFLMILWSISFILLSIILSFLKVSLLLSWQFIISAIFSFFLSRMLFKRYYTSDRKRNIIDKTTACWKRKIFSVYVGFIGRNRTTVFFFLLGRYIFLFDN